MRYIGVRKPAWAFLAAIMVALMIGVPAFAVTLQEEIDLGKKLDAQILKEKPVSSDQSAQKEIDRLGQIVVKKGGLNRPTIEYHFKVLKGTDLNAFSTCGGYIYFTDHLWSVLRTDERAGVLAHEIVHSDRRHALDAVLKQQKRSTILGAILILAGAGRTISDVVGIANQLSSLKYSRGDEKQADQIGLQYLHSAGMNPAGLLLALRKIGKFEAEAGQKQPTILMNHPQTPERLRYITEDLRKMGVTVPPDDVVTKNSSDRIGAITSLSNTTVEFTSSKSLKPSDVVWIMGTGWDYYYESRTATPVARVVVASVKGSGYTGKPYVLNAAKAKSIGKGMEVYDPPVPPLPSGVGFVVADPKASFQSYTVQSERGQPFAKMQRLLPVSVVWNDKGSKLANEPVGYAVVTDPAIRLGGTVLIQRPKYSYAPVNTGAVLVNVTDPDSARWAGTVLSIGKSSRQVEVVPNLPLDPGKIYEVAYPAWEKTDSYAQRVVAKAKFTKTGSKVVMSITEFAPGWSIDQIQPGFDVYEQSSRK